MGEVWSDLRFAVRSFFRNPGLTGSITLILAVGIGSITLLFSVLNAAVLRPLPYPRSDELVWLWGTNAQIPEHSISYDDLVDYRNGTNAFESLAGYTLFDDTRLLTGRQGAEMVTAGRVTANLFATLGVQPQVGRLFRPQEETTGLETVTILNHDFWLRHFGGDPAVVGSVVSLDDRPVEIVGVMPSWFDLPAGADIWVPIQQSEGYCQDRGNNMFYAIGRLREGMSIQQAETQLDAVAKGIAEAFPDVKAGWRVRLVTLHERFFGKTRDMLLLLMGIVSLVPIVACANIASLLLVRASSRTAEMASRMAFGASRTRLVRQLLTENFAMALAGGCVGLGLAWLGGRALQALAPAALPRLDALGIDGRVMAFTLLISFLTVPLFGVLPVLRGTDLRIAEELKVGGGRGGSGSRTGFRNALVVAQVALSLMLLAASGLLLRSYRKLHTQDLGFRMQNLFQAQVDLPAFKYDTYADVQADWDGIFRALEESPAVASVAAVDVPPLTGWGPTNDVWNPEHPPADATARSDGTRRYVTDDYFDVMGIDLIAGRTFQADDRPDSQDDPPVVINEALARRFFPREDPVGKTLVFDYDVVRHLEIIGVVADVKEGDPGSANEPTFYLQSRWRPRLSMAVFLRPSRGWAVLSSAMREAVQAVDPDIPAPGVRSVDTRLSDRLFQPRFRSMLVSLFSLVTLVLAAVGLYGVVAFFARSRRREMGIRMALGAQARAAAALVFRQGLTLVGAGVVAGLAGSLAGARVLRGWLFGVGSMDSLTLGGVSVFLLAVGCAACLVPTLRTMKVSPVEVLREE